jgi:hypothetical protein
MKKYAWLAAVLMVLLCTRGAYAFILKHGESVQIPQEETVNEDLYITGGDVEVDGTVNAALFVAARNVTVRGTVKRQAVIIARHVKVLGAVGGGLKAMGQDITVSGTTMGDLMLFGANIDITEQSRIGGDTLFGGRYISVNGVLQKDVLGGGKRITLNNAIDGNAKLAVQELYVTDSARIGGNLTYYSKNQAVIAQGARIKGTITQHLPEYGERVKKLFPFALLTGIAGKIVGFLMMVLFGLVLILVMPVWMRSVSGAISERPGACAGWGALLLFVSPIAIAAALATVIGAAVGGVALLLYLAAILISQVAVSLLIGRMIIGREKSGESKGLLFGAFVLGLVILSFLKMIPLFGRIVMLAAALFGIGAIVVAEATRRREEGTSIL